MEAISNRVNGVDWQISTVVADIHRLAQASEFWDFLMSREKLMSLSIKLSDGHSRQIQTRRFLFLVFM